MELLGARTSPNTVQVEILNGQKVTRSLYRCPAAEVRGWSHAKEFWRVHKESVTLSTGKKVEEQHYYVTSLAPSRLSDADVAKTIRAHWSIENNANWVMDVAWEEDSGPWCNQALELITLMRLIAYNIVARFKLSRLRRVAARRWTWKDTLYFITIAVFPLNQDRAFATR